MRRALDWVKKNVKLIVAVALLLALIVAVYFINSAQKTQTSASFGSEKSSTEIKLTEILSAIDGVGSADVMIHESEGVIVGVIIVCEGADNIMTRSDILNAVSTALNVQKSIIAIYSKSV